MENTPIPLRPLLSLHMTNLVITKQLIVQVLQQSMPEELAQALSAQAIESSVQRAKSVAMADWASTIAMQAAKILRQSPIAIAEQLAHGIDNLKNGEASWLESVEVAGNGYLNFKVSASQCDSVIAYILETGAGFGKGTNTGNILVEFVSANPTGMLHIGHGRNAIVGDVMGNVLTEAGYNVSREYYINDSGHQIDVLGMSALLAHNDLPVPVGAYGGGVLAEAISTEQVQTVLKKMSSKTLVAALASVLDANDNEDEADDGLTLKTAVDIVLASNPTDYKQLKHELISTFLVLIGSDLSKLNVNFDFWASEAALAGSETVSRVIAQLEQVKKDGVSVCERKEGALWLRTDLYGDEKPRVLVRSNGQHTYFAADIAYHHNKLTRAENFHCIDVWGADHHGYIERVKAALSALGHDIDRFEVLLVQFVSLSKGKERMKLSKRTGSYFTVNELMASFVPPEPLRLLYLQRASESHLAIDVEVAQMQTADNPLYYIQYAHARSCRVISKANEVGVSIEQTGEQTGDRAGDMKGNYSYNDDDRALLNLLEDWPELIAKSADSRQPHQVLFALEKIAAQYHSHYSKYPVANCSDQDTATGRLRLTYATRQVIANGLRILGVSAPTSM